MCGLLGFGNVQLPFARRANRVGGVASSYADREAISAVVTTPYGHVASIAAGESLVFGRGPGAQLTISADRALSRRAGMITMLEDGAWIGNLSRTHGLYVVFEESRVRLPPLPAGRTEPLSGWFVRSGTALVGSATMLDGGSALQISITSTTAEGPSGPDQGTMGESTVVPLALDPFTKLYLVGLLWCRPWLLDASRATPLPRAPEIARAALEVTGAQYELGRFDADPRYRDQLSARVGEHLRVLRRKIAARGLVKPGIRLSDEVVVQVILEHAVLTHADLARLDDPEWRSRQEDLWWQQL